MKERARAADIHPASDGKLERSFRHIRSRLVHNITIDWALLAPEDLVESISIVRNLMPDCQPNRDLNLDVDITVERLNTLKTAATHRILAAEVNQGYMIYADACYAVRACQAHLTVLRRRRWIAEINHINPCRDLGRPAIAFEDSDPAADNDFSESDGKSENMEEGAL